MAINPEGNNSENSDNQNNGAEWAVLSNNTETSQDNDSGWDAVANETQAGQTQGAEATKEPAEAYSEGEMAVIEQAKDAVIDWKQRNPNMSDDEIHQLIIAHMGYSLDIKGFGLFDQQKNILPSVEDRNKLELMYNEVMRLLDNEKEDAAETEETGETQFTEKELEAIRLMQSHYAEYQQIEPDANPYQRHEQIISGLGYYLGIPGYRLADQQKNILPSVEDRNKLELMYQQVVGSDEPGPAVN